MLISIRLVNKDTGEWRISDKREKKIEIVFLRKLIFYLKIIML